MTEAKEPEGGEGFRERDLERGGRERETEVRDGR